MELFSIWDHHIAIGAFQRTCQDIASRVASEGSSEVDERLAKSCETVLQKVETECDKFKLDAVVDLISYTRITCKHIPRPTIAELSDRLDTIAFMLQSQAEKQKFFWMTRDESKMFDNASLFGTEVVAAFPKEETLYEIKESGSCFALGRYTASVFHLMRVLEKGLKALAENLQVPFSIPFEYLNWQNIIEPIESKIRDLNEQKAGAYKTETLKAYSELAKQFRYFKDAWRNHVSHSRETYDKEQALSIQRHTGEFMRDLVKLGLLELKDEVKANN